MTPLAWLFVAFLIAVNGFFVAAEFAAVSVRRSRIRQLADQGNRFARMLVPVITDAAALDRYVAACQIGITASSLGLGAFAQARMSRALVPLFEDLGWMQSTAAHSTSAVVVLVGLTVLQVVLGELVPKSLALEYPAQAALYTALPMRWSLAAFSWFIAVLNGSGIAILRLLRIPYGGHRHIHSPEEIDLLIAESKDGGLLEDDEHLRLREALRLASRTAGELRVPRSRVAAIEIAMPREEVLSFVAEGPFTRVPVFSGSLDNVVGIIHTNDIVIRHLDSGAAPQLPEIMRPAVFIPEHATIARLVATLREKRSHMAIVVDEYGGVSGLVTLEDVLTALLGEFGDELKTPEPRPQSLPDGRVRLPGTLPLRGAGQWTGVAWRGGASTVGGHVTEALGRLPIAGDRTTIGGVAVEVEQVERNAVISVLVRPVHPEEDA